MPLTELTEFMLPAIEAELRRQVARLYRPPTTPFYEMLAYHMGWNGDAGTGAGKRIRPLVTLLTTAASGGGWLHATPVAAAVELLHNFSLVHDDIQDNSPTRRGRVTAWKKYGMPMAINIGDALFSISSLAAVNLSAHYPAETVLRAAACLHEACLDLTTGQYLDMSYEKRLDLTTEDYWPMVEGKTAALLSAAAQIGAILGGADEATRKSYSAFGRYLGLAFQVQDDILGVWGDEAAIGKSAASDLVEGKNSLPVLYGLAQKAAFARRWAEGPVLESETRELAGALAADGARDYCAAEADRLTAMAMDALHSAHPGGDAGEALSQLAAMLLQRQS
ncbi:MAG TPA: polyprenyl synthetase family protein [Anaerolineales bacterium]|nr:polyprenyl synthetase family protein [Anaerolineales bacterium]